MFGDNLDRIVAAIEKNYEADEIFFTKPGRRFPSRLAVKNVLKTLRRVLFPGYFGTEMLSPSTRLTPERAVPTHRSSCLSMAMVVYRSLSPSRMPDI